MIKNRQICLLKPPPKNAQTLQMGASFDLPVPEIIDSVFAKTSQNARFLISENERFRLVFVKTGSINSGTGYGSNPDPDPKH